MSPSFQQRVANWMRETFPRSVRVDQQERCWRFYEEAGELVQSLGMTRDQAHQMVDYTWGREVGQPSQEIGQVIVTLSALANGRDIDVQQAAENELERINTPEMIAKIKEKWATKHLRGKGVIP